MLDPIRRDIRWSLDTAENTVDWIAHEVDGRASASGLSLATVNPSSIRTGFPWQGDLERFVIADSRQPGTITTPDTWRNGLNKLEAESEVLQEIRAVAGSRRSSSGLLADLRFPMRDPETPAVSVFDMRQKERWIPHHCRMGPDSIRQVRTWGLVFLISHAWETPKHPDPRGEQLAIVKRLLDSFVSIARTLVEFRQTQRIDEAMPDWLKECARDAATWPGVRLMDSEVRESGWQVLEKHIGVWYDYEVGPERAHRETCDACSEEFLDVIGSLSSLVQNSIVVCIASEEQRRARGWIIHERGQNMRPGFNLSVDWEARPLHLVQGEPMTMPLFRTLCRLHPSPFREPRDGVLLRAIEVLELGGVSPHSWFFVRWAHCFAGDSVRDPRVTSQRYAPLFYDFLDLGELDASLDKTLNCRGFIRELFLWLAHGKVGPREFKKAARSLARMEGWCAHAFGFPLDSIKMLLAWRLQSWLVSAAYISSARTEEIPAVGYARLAHHASLCASLYTWRLQEDADTGHAWHRAIEREPKLLASSFLRASSSLVDSDAARASLEPLLTSGDASAT